MSQLITFTWRMSPKTFKAARRRGYSDAKQKKVCTAFIERHLGKDLEHASSDYYKMLCKEAADNIKPKDDGALGLIQDAKSHKSEDGIERAQEAKTQEGVMTKAEAIAWYASNR